MIIALMTWFTTIIFSMVLGTYLCFRIEKHGVKRWGATGRLYQYKQKEGE
ncbi:hypothetical protein [Halobacillus sp. A5]|nr:hypothetical protein [Halobacillus sp. A5]MCP3028628.1 hypothetical protein [Halobacillus sp. A5]